MELSKKEKKQAETAALQEERRYILSECSSEYFIEEYCWIESKDELNISAVPFKLWPKQKIALKEIQENKLNIILKARQLGLTWLVICHIVGCCLQFGGFTALILSETEPKSKELINRADFVLRHLPTWLIISEKKFKEIKKAQGEGAYSGLYWVKTALSIEVRYGDESKEVATIKAQACTEGAGRSLTGDIVFFDEWSIHKWASGVWDAAYPTINRPGSGKFIGLSTNKRGSFFESIWKGATKKGFHSIFLDCFADPRRTQEWYDQSFMALGSKVQQEYPRTVEEALLAGDNISFPEFSYDIHVCEEFADGIPKHWRRIASVDNGYNDPYAWYKAAISDDGIVYIYYEQSRWRDEPQLLYDEQAREFNSSLFYWDDEDKVTKREKLDYIVAGLDAWHKNHRDKTNKNLIDYYIEGGLTKEGFLPAVTDRILRKATWHEYLKPIYDENSETWGAKLQICSNCTYLIETLPQLVNDERNPEKVADLSDIDNPYDAAGYLLISRHAQKSVDKTRPQTTLMQRHKQAKFKQIKRRR